MNSRGVGRLGHGLTALVVVFAVGLQLILVVAASPVLVDGPTPALPVRLTRLISYFTIQSNLLVLVTAVGLLRRPDRDGPVWRVLRLDAVVGIAVTGLVHWFLLRPLLDLSGWSAVADAALHLAVPALAVLSWAVFGPRPRITGRVIGYGLIWPVGWLAYTMIAGGLTGWYPYPFLDPGLVEPRSVVVSALGITGLIAALSGLLWLVDRRLSPAPTAPAEIS